jgi:hypothetical protein
MSRSIFWRATNPHPLSRVTSALPPAGATGDHQRIADKRGEVALCVDWPNPNNNDSAKSSGIKFIWIVHSQNYQAQEQFGIYQSAETVKSNP